MGWPVGRPHTAASEGMKRWHREHSKGREVKPKKPSRSLHFLSPEERKEYDLLRRYGVSREAAITAIIAEPKERG
jgi:hypothetical protein